MSTILAFVIGLLFAGFGAVNTGVHSYQVRTVEAKRARYGALEEAIASEQSASFESSGDAQGARERNDEKARNQAVSARVTHLKNAIAARLTLGTNSSNAEAE